MRFKFRIFKLAGSLDANIASAEEIILKKTENSPATKGKIWNLLTDLIQTTYYSQTDLRYVINSKELKPVQQGDFKDASLVLFSSLISTF